MKQPVCLHRASATPTPTAGVFASSGTELPPDLLRDAPKRLDRPHSAAELADRLAACSRDGDWGRKEAEHWWLLHRPEPAAWEEVLNRGDSPVS